MKCIICDNENESKSVEHIVPESFGNKDYVMQKGEICDECNNMFSKFENKALSNTIFVMERARFGIKTKKGKPAKGRIKELEIEGSKDLTPSLIGVVGLNSGNFKNYNPITKTGDLYVSSFDKSESATAKLLLKIGVESIYKSQHKIYEKYNFQDLKDHLKGKTNTDWSFIRTDLEIEKFTSVLRYIDKHKLKNKHYNLGLLEVDENTLLFKFKFGAVAMVINLVNKNNKWIESFYQKDNSISIFPEHIKNKIVILFENKTGNVEK